MAHPITRLVLALTAGSFLLGGVALGDPSVPASAEAGPGVQVPGHPRVNQVNRRERRQQKRIAHGVADGSLNPNEAARLEQQQSQLQQQEAADLAQHNGHLTHKQRHQLNRAENHLSHEIHQERHDAN